MSSSLSNTTLLAVAVIVALLPGCGGRERTADDKAKPRVALVMKSLANEFFTTMADGARKHHEQHPESEYGLIVNGIKDRRDLARRWRSSTN
ncbi:MAG: hypothetical protein U0736_08660 [Gemmataceae bacterium]